MSGLITLCKMFLPDRGLFSRKFDLLRVDGFRWFSYFYFLMKTRRYLSRRSSLWLIEKKHEEKSLSKKLIQNFPSYLRKEMQSKSIPSNVIAEYFAFFHDSFKRLCIDSTRVNNLWNRRNKMHGNPFEWNKTLLNSN